MKDHIPKKAILLAAGYGTRIQPLSCDLPKPMMPIWGKPAIGHMIDLMSKFGVHEILINLHHNPEPIIDFCRHYPAGNMQIEFSFEPQIMGTGGALKKAAWFIQDSDFWLVNTDIVADVHPEPFLREFERSDRPLAVLWLHPKLGPRTVEMKNNTISCFRSKHPGGKGTFTFCGFQLVSHAILKYLPNRIFSSIIEAYSAAMSDGERISGIAPGNTFWSDIGTANQYIEAHRQILDTWKVHGPGSPLFDRAMLRKVSSLRRRGVTINGFAAIGKSVAIAHGTSITDSILWDKAMVLSSSQLANTIVARGTTVRGAVDGMAIQCNKIKDDNHLSAALAGIEWQPKLTTAIPLGARGSARSFTRLINKNKSVIYIRYSTEREENTHYTEIARFLRENGIPVPGILFDSPWLCITVMDDLGNCPLEKYAKETSGIKLESMYQKVLDALNLLHDIPVRCAHQARIHLQPPFSPDLYKWERQLLRDNLLTRKLHLNSGEISAIMRDLEEVAQKLIKARHALLHRDFQSSNIFLRHDRPFFLDFQGLRPGPPAYDLASLLCDPYVMLPEDMQVRLLDYYTTHNVNGNEIRKTFWLAAVQRLAQALGAYGRLSALPGTEMFASHIKPAMLMMSRVLDHLDGLKAIRRLTCSI